MRKPKPKPGPQPIVVPLTAAQRAGLTRFAEELALIGAKRQAYASGICDGHELPDDLTGYRMEIHPDSLRLVPPVRPTTGPQPTPPADPPADPPSDPPAAS